MEYYKSKRYIIAHLKEYLNDLSNGRREYDPSEFESLISRLSMTTGISKKTILRQLEIWGMEYDQTLKVFKKLGA